MQRPYNVLFVCTEVNAIPLTSATSEASVTMQSRCEAC